MKQPPPNDSAPPLLPPEVTLDEAEILERKAFLQFTDADARHLREIHERLDGYRDAFTHEFYARLLEVPELREVLDDEARLARLKQAQARYFQQLTAGDYGGDYVSDRLRVGIAHQRIGLDTKWYVGAYSNYLVSLLKTMWSLFDGDAARFLDAYGALLKVVCFDITIALDTYHHAEVREIVQHKNYAAHLVNCLTLGVVVLEDGLRVRSLNPCMEEILGMAPGSLTTGATLDALLPDPELAAAIRDVTSGGSARKRLVVGAAVGGKGLLHLDIDVEMTELQGERLVLLFVQDVTASRTAETLLRASEERFRMTFNNAAIGLAHSDLDGRVLKSNDKLCEIVGLSPGELKRMDIRTHLHPDDLQETLRLASRLFQGELDSYVLECRYLHKGGYYVWLNVTASALREDPEGFRFILVVEDISRRKVAEEKLMYFAGHDALTGLSNRMLLEDRMANAFVFARRSGRHAAVLFIDLDRFKHINDGLGHAAGDQTLVTIARRLESAVREGDTVARLSGDEFVVLLTDVAFPHDIAPIAENILRKINEPIHLQGQEVFLGCSIGISVFPRDAEDPAALVQCADIAMYRAKQGGRNRIVFYKDEMRSSVRDHLAVKAALRHALERNEFILHYQPQVSLSSGELTGFEALVRWAPPGKPVVQPSDFIPIAEDSGLILALGDWVLREACRQHRAWRRAGLGHVKIAVNLSAYQFRQHKLVERITDILLETRCSPGCITLEITESVVMDDPESAAHTLRRLNEMGIHLAIDDFGTGYSSLSYLKRFPIDTLKIDRAFIRDITADSDDAAIVKSIVALAEAMKLNVVAEGVETEEQRAFLLRLGCEFGQGYLFGKPLPAAEWHAFPKDLVVPLNLPLDDSCVPEPRIRQADRT